MARGAGIATALRVLILTPDIYTRGGIARYTATLASTLADLIGASTCCRCWAVQAPVKRCHGSTFSIRLPAG